MHDRATTQPLSRYRLFDSSGLPWTSSLSWYSLYLITLITGFAFALLLGIYLGLWLRSKGRGRSVLLLYLAITALAISLFFLPNQAHHSEDILLSVAVILWFAAAYLLRRKVVGYYSDREATPFKINPILAAFSSVWFINGCLRADFPLDEAGKASEGVLKLTV